MRSSHHSLAESLQRKHIINSPSCKCGYPCEDLNHVLWHCPLHSQHRVKLFTQLNKLKIFPPIDIDSIISEPNIKASIIISNFFQKCNITV